MVNGNNYSASSGPVGVEADGEISWFSRWIKSREGLVNSRWNASNSSADAESNEPDFGL